LRQPLFVTLSLTAILAALLFAATPTYAYSVLSHESIIDSMWDETIVKLLQRRFPNATAEDLQAAHAFAYGGCIIQDMGYYPFGARFFTDLTHYVRSGDFVEAMLRNAQDINEYAFALGSLAHYAADNNGHRIAINRAVPLLYPKLLGKFGNEVAYEDDPGAHLKTEFGIDVLQVARGRYVSDRYRQFIGFEVSKPLLERAFLDTYGLELDDVFGNVDLAIGSYRRSVSSIIPKMTRVAWELKKDDLEKSIPGITRDKFLYNLSRASFEKEWGKNYKEPGFGTKAIAFLVRLVPKIGPFRVLQFRTPTPEVEKLYLESVEAALASYRQFLAAEAAGRRDLPNQNLDLGKPIQYRSYKMADQTYEKLLEKLAKGKSASVPADLQANIVSFYKGPPQSKSISRLFAKLKLNTNGSGAKQNR
jgi:hypothetical protein